ncbi:MAG: sugar ABC transporter ATP-binding protein [Gemmataceae bacterium]
MNAPPLLQVENVTKRFPGVKALDGVSLSVYPGEVLAVVGENGAGKSTLMKIMAGIYTPDEGRLLLDGTPVRLGSINEMMDLGVSLIHQELNLCEDLSVAANVFLGREPVGSFGVLSESAMFRETQSLLDRVGLECFPRTIVGGLSPGHRQLVEIARALSMNVRVLIMDEPTTSLTQKETEKLYEVIAGLKESGVAIVYISHRLGEIEILADRVVVLRDGNYVGELARSSRDAHCETNDQPQSSLLDTNERDEITHDAMVRLMVGREASQFFQRQHNQNPDRERLTLREVRYTGVPSVADGISEPMSFTIHEGEILGMSGLVGAGRTELAETLFGLRSVFSGEIGIDGELVAFQTPEQAISAGLVLVPEDRKRHGLVLDDTIEHNFSLPNLDTLSRGQIVNRKQERGLAEELRSKLGVRTPSVLQTVGLLSGGNQQKVVLGKWLARKPRVLIVDEPTRGVDVGAKSEIYSLLDQLADEGTAILMISSDLEEILGMSDRVAVLHEGRLAGILSRNQLSEEAVMSLATGGRRN